MSHLKNTSLVVLCLSLSACGSAERLANVGKAPDMSHISNPQLQAGYKPVTMPMPAPKPDMKQENSLWSSNRQTFFKDQRAGKVGDILTVMVDIKDDAKLDNETERTRDGGEATDLDAFFGMEADLAKILPEEVNNNSLVNLAAKSKHTGKGSVDRKEDISLKLAALITQVLPNGNLVIHGSQEVLVNFEKRVVQIDGIIRPEDITPENTVPHEKIAEARVIYGGEGPITDVQQPRYGQQVFDVVYPF
jgi:flagellar L-ring protein precursor FlgH